MASERTSAMASREQSRGEELANSASHGAALFAAVASVPFLLDSTRHGSIESLVGALVFGLTLVALYAASTLYHALPEGRHKQLFLRLDHGAIYFFIAGSYTPFALAAMQGMHGWLLLGLVWSLALVGATLKILSRLSAPWLSTGLYLLMGWLVLAAAIPAVKSVPQAVMDLLVYGGVAYTLGVFFFVLDARVKYAHTIWHGFVAVGSAFHCLAVLGCAR